MSEVNTETEQNNLADEKLRIEIKKLELEANELNKKWFKKPQWYATFIPLILGFGTLGIAYNTGFLNVQSLVNRQENIKNQNESILLQIQIREFDSVKIKLKRENDLLIVKGDSLKNMIGNYEDKIKYLQKLLRDTYSKSKSDNQKYNDLLLENLQMKDSISNINFAIGME